MIMLVASSLKAILCSDDGGEKDLLQRERGLEMPTALRVQVLLKRQRSKIQTLGERSAMYSAKQRNKKQMSCSNLQGEGLSEIHTHTAVVLPEHSEHSAGHTPQTLILLRFALK